jgi:hypothetical protein
VTFREQATEDLPTFLNVDEFADTVEFDGVAVACVVEGNGDTDATEDGVINRDTLYHARASDFEVIPVVGQRLTIDDDKGDVIAVSEDQGILEIRVRWFDS